MKLIYNQDGRVVMVTEGNLKFDDKKFKSKTDNTIKDADIREKFLYVEDGKVKKITKNLT